MKTKRYIHNGLNCEYLVYGSGERIMYCFHGFGGSMFDWEVFSSWMDTEFTVYSFNDFFHQESIFPHERIENNPLTKSELAQFYASFAKENKHDVINIMAFSSGGRTALTLIENQAAKFDEIWLFAADGLEISFWNKAFCRFPFIQELYKKIIYKPELFFKTIRALEKSHLLNKDLAKFVLFSMRNEEKRKKIYNYWMTYRNIIPNRKKLHKSIKSSIRKMHLIIGKEDRVIKPEIAMKFKRQHSKKMDVLVLNGGHFLLDKKYSDLLKKEYQ